MDTRQLAYGNEQITYQVLRSARRQKTISIRVQPNGIVQVAAPSVARDRDIESMVATRADWIWHHLQQVRVTGRTIQPHRYVSGERHLYLGQHHLLKIHDTIKTGHHIKLEHGFLNVSTHRTDPPAIRKLLMRWYREQAQQVFNQRLATLVPSLPWKQHVLPAVRLRSMKKRWGSCSSNGVITLNPHLVKAPAQCVDYVICHELCHLREFNHSPRFYRLLDQVRPGWRVTRAKLDGWAGILLNV